MSASASPAAAPAASVGTIFSEAVMQSPIGMLRVTASELGLRSIKLCDDDVAPSEPNHPLLARCVLQLREYFEGTRDVFDLPLDPEGSAFRLSVWRALLAIPAGEVRTYGDIAKTVGCKSARAVGGAVGANPLAVLIPCHRVVPGTYAAGDIGGFAWGVERKRWLLKRERGSVL